jgi:hypothetical protein
MGQTDGTLVFLHIPRAGGTTFRWLIERNYPVRAIYADYRGEAVVPVDTLSPVHRERLRCVSSHQPFGTYDDFLNPPVQVVTMLRDPILREVSHYYYRQRLNSHSIHPIARHASMQEYFEAVSEYRVDNYQVRLLSGQGDSGEVNSDSLARAKENLASRISAFGLTEKFGESVALMARVVGWNRLAYVVRNQSRNRPGNPDSDEKLLALASGVTRYDDQLYQLASTLFEKRLGEFAITAEEASRVHPANGVERLDHAWFRLRLRAADLIRRKN